MKTLIAIDPGVSGGVAVWTFGVAGCRPMPRTEGDIAGFGARDYVGVGQVGRRDGVRDGGGRAGMSGRPQPGSAMFRFGENCGFHQGGASRRWASGWCWCARRFGRRRSAWARPRRARRRRFGRTSSRPRRNGGFPI